MYSIMRILYKITRWSFILFLITHPLFVFAQKQDYMWPLGLGPGWSDFNFFFDFKSDPPGITLRSDPTSNGLYTSSYCDSAGNILAYSNGIMILNRYGELIENGKNPNPTLGDEWQNEKASYPGGQSGFFLSHPGDDNILYFISLDFGYHPRGKWPFLHTGHRLLAATIDLRANEGKGKVIKKHEVLAEGILMAPAAVRHANGRDWWILTPDADSNRYYRVLLSPTGFSKAEVQLIGSKPDNIAMGRGNSLEGNCFSPSGKLYIDQNCYIGFGVFDFDRCSGLLSNERRREYPAPLPPHYVSQLDGGSGAVFSADDRFLYMTNSWIILGSTIGIGSKPYLLQYDLKASDWIGSVDTLNFGDPFSYFPFVKGYKFEYFLGAEQGPDGRIYIVHHGDSYCTVQYPNRRGKDCKFRYDDPDFENVISRAIPYMPNYRLGPLDGSPCDTLGLNNVPIAHFRIDDSLNLLSRYFYDLSYHEPTFHTLLFLLFFFSAVSSQAQDRPIGRAFATRSEVMARNGIACTSHPLATSAALDVLRKGGSAVDAAIAANAVLGVVEPHVNGMGGDLYAIVYEAKTKKLYGLNGSGRSPYTLTLDTFQRRGIQYIPALGPLPVSVPGCVDGWFALHGKFGRRPMRDNLSYAIGYARDGFAVADEASHSWQRVEAVYGKFPNVREVYLPGGKAPQRGEIFRNPQLANTLEKIAIGGRDVFYKGEIARTIAEFMKKSGGFLTARDLAEHTSEWVEPVSVNYRGYDVWELPPNGQGICALQMLNILEGFDFSKIEFGSPEHLHLFVEAKKLAFEDRARFYADLEYMEPGIVNRLLSKGYADQRRKLINPARAAQTVEAGNPNLKDGDTIYLTVADGEGNMVSLIQSNFRGFGSGMVPDGLGFMLQDRGQLFTLTPGQANTYAPHKRPFHTIIPAFVTKDGKPWMSFGVMGGSFQPLGHVEILMNIIDFGMNAQEAGDAPRIDHQGSSEPTGEQMKDSGQITLEDGFPYETIRALMQKGHRVGWAAPGAYGGYQAIRFDAASRVYFGASESRKDGQAAGW